LTLLLLLLAFSISALAPLDIFLGTMLSFCFLSLSPFDTQSIPLPIPWQRNRHCRLALGLNLMKWTMDGWVDETGGSETRGKQNKIQKTLGKEMTTTRLSGWRDDEGDGEEGR
jgi:hypothetical protein